MVISFIIPLVSYLHVFCTVLLGVLASAPTQSSTEGIAEVVGVHRIPRRTAPTSNTERAMLVYVIDCYI